MRSHDTQMDLGIKPKATAAEWRAAAEACEQQFPGDAARLAYYLAKVEAAEREQMQVAA